VEIRRVWIESIFQTHIDNFGSPPDDQYQIEFFPFDHIKQDKNRYPTLLQK